MTSTADRELIITRLIHAPRELVFAAFTDPAQVDLWWGPTGFENETQEMDVRPGGLWRFWMRHPQHGEFQNRVAYTEVVRPERLVYVHGSDEKPDQFHVTITFADESGKTRLTMHTVLPTAADLEEKKKFGAVEGGKQTIDKLERYLAARADVRSSA